MVVGGAIGQDHLETGRNSSPIKRIRQDSVRRLCRKQWGEFTNNGLRPLIASRIASHLQPLSGPFQCPIQKRYCAKLHGNYWLPYTHGCW